MYYMVNIKKIEKTVLRILLLKSQANSLRNRFQEKDIQEKLYLEHIKELSVLANNIVWKEKNHENNNIYGWISFDFYYRF